MSRPTVLRSLALIGAASLALAACGSSSSAPDSGSSPTGGTGALKLGTLLPQTGSLAFLGPPEFAGVDAAVKDINDAGGVLGSPVTVSQGAAPSRARIRQASSTSPQMGMPCAAASASTGWVGRQPGEVTTRS